MSEKRSCRSNPRHPFRTNPSRPLLVGHRGAAAIAPENTLAAFQKAAALHCDFLECDVQFTADHVPIVFHDSSLDRLTNLSGAVAQHSWNDLKTQAKVSGCEPLLSFAELVTFAKSVQTSLFVEIKNPRSTDSVIQILTEANFLECALLGSFDTSVVAHATSHHLPALWLLHESAPLSPSHIQTALELRATCLGIPRQIASPSAMALAHEANLALWVWTVNSPEEMNSLSQLGADALITDCPEVFWQTFPENSPSPRNPSSPLAALP